MARLKDLLKERLVAVIVTLSLGLCATAVRTYYKVQNLQTELASTQATVARHEEDSKKLAELNGTMKAVLEELRQLREDIRADRTHTK
jgi:uncharacterized membrane protein (DUF106 family)